jgi:hypothetical protein
VRKASVLIQVDVDEQRPTPVKTANNAPTTIVAATADSAAP